MNGHFDIGDLSPAKLFIGVSSILGLIIALIIDPPQMFIAHIIHWQVQTAGAVIFIISTHIVLFKFIKLQILSPWLAVAVSGLLGALIFSPVATLSDMLFAGEDLKEGFKAELINELISIIPPMTLAWLAMNAPWLMGYRLWRSAATETKLIKEPGSSQASKTLKPDFLAHTNIESINTILYIKSELHYINIVTKTDKYLILFSLKEAIAQLNHYGKEGIQCHRSYWVANTAIKELKRSGREAEFLLTNGDRVPISRSNVSKCIEIRTHT